MLSWSNEAKVAALAKQERDLSIHITEHTRQILDLKREGEERGRILGLSQQLAVFANFAELDWKALVAANRIGQRGMHRGEVPAGEAHH